MHLFYNVIGVVIGVQALLMLRVCSPQGDEWRQFNAVKRYLAAVFLLTSLSMFAAQFEMRIQEEQFEKLNAAMLLFFLLISQGFLYSLLILYASPHANRKYLQRTLLPVLPLFTVYAVVCFFMGDVQVYSAEEFMSLLPHEFRLMLRCILLAASIGSVVYGVLLCHKAKNEYDRLIAGYFSETDFARSLWLYKLLWSAEALSIWVVMTYFYTNDVFEILVGLLIAAVFAFYLKEFRKYVRRYPELRPAIIYGQSGGEIAAEQFSAKGNPQKQAVRAQIEKWAERPDKPFTRPRLSIEDVSRETGLPKRKISQYTNQADDNFCSWINKLRIEEAVAMLRDSHDISITEIADAVGFCDLPAFSRSFKKIKGTSPSAFRSDANLQSCTGRE